MAIDLEEATRRGMSHDQAQRWTEKNDILVRLRRPDGRETIVRVPGEHLQRLMDLANGEFGDTSIQIGGPELPVTKAK